MINTSKSTILAKLRPYFHVCGELEHSNGVILCDGRIVLPATLQQKVLMMAHAGHPGMVRMKQKLRDSYWWPGLDSQVEFVVKHCEGCQYSRKSQPPDPILPISILKPPGPWKRLGLDLAGPYSTAPHQQQFIVSIFNYYSRYLEVLLTTDTWASAIIRWLRELFAWYGCPDDIVMDNGPQFAHSQDFIFFLEQYGVCPLPVSVYNPRENG